MFTRECLQGGVGRDVLYDTMNREDLNWRKFHEQVAHKTVRTFKASGKKAYVVDDSVKQRFGKKLQCIFEPFRSYQRPTYDGTASADLGLELR